jgi:hypothetical protein
MQAGRRESRRFHEEPGYGAKLASRWCRAPASAAPHLTHRFSSHRCVPWAASSILPFVGAGDETRCVVDGSHRLLRIVMPSCDEAGGGRRTSSMLVDDLPRSGNRCVTFAGNTNWSCASVSGGNHRNKNKSASLALSSGCSSARAVDAAATLGCGGSDSAEVELGSRRKPTGTVSCMRSSGAASSCSRPSTWPISWARTVRRSTLPKAGLLGPAGNSESSVGGR